MFDNDFNLLESELDNFDTFDYDIDTLEEAYYGKTAGLKKAEKLLKPIIEYCHGVYNGTFKKMINETKEVKELEKIFADEFNIGEFTITFYTISATMGLNTLTPNAFTRPTSFQCLKRSKTNSKLVDTKDAFVGVNVDIALVVMLDLTPEELMGAILHEIGHCMNASVFTFLATLPSYMDLKNLKTTFDSMDTTNKVSYIISTILATLIKKPINRLAQWIDKMLNNVLALSPELNSVIKQIMGQIYKFITVINPFLTLTSFIKNPLMTLQSYLSPRSMFGYQTERFSDSFATAYGYGVGLSTFLNKLENDSSGEIKDIYSEIPVFGIGRDIADVSMKIVSMLADPHPSNPSRIIHQLNKMKRDLQDPNLDQRVKKELLNNIERLEDIVNNEILNEKEYETERTGLTPIKFFYNYAIIKVFNGKLDPRELMNIGNHYEL